MPRHFGLFAKRPQAGSVKTRLAADLGDDAAAEIYAAFTADLVQRFRHVADRRFIGYTPNDEATRTHFQALCGDDYELQPQRGGDLSKRIAAFFGSAFSSGATSAVLIGTDSPTLPLPIVEEAHQRLETADCVLGPATDGGFYLIGLTRLHPPLFEGIAWSSADVLAQIVHNLAAADFSLQLLPVWYDVDTCDDLAFLQGHLDAMQAAGMPDIAPQTSAILEKHTRRNSAGL